MSELFLFRKLVFLFWMPLIKTNDVSLAVRLSQQPRKSSPRYGLERTATHRGLQPPGRESAAPTSVGTTRLGAEALQPIRAR